MFLIEIISWLLQELKVYYMYSFVGFSPLEAWYLGFASKVGVLLFTAIDSSQFVPKKKKPTKL